MLVKWFQAAIILRSCATLLKPILCAARNTQNQLVTDCFEKHFKMTDRIKVTRTFEMSERDVRVFAEMTPLLFGIDAESLNLSRGEKHHHRG